LIAALSAGDGVLPAAATVFFVYLGFEKIANMTEEVRKSLARHSPRHFLEHRGHHDALRIGLSCGNWIGSPERVGEKRGSIGFGH
jgi:hypothetical protein